MITFPGCQSETQDELIFHEDFEQGSLDTSRWEVTLDGDFTEVMIDVTDVDPGEDADYRLRFRANTIATSTPLKFLGVRSKNTIDVGEGITLTFDLDWNNQTNGSYLTAALYFCPAISNNPKEEDNWLKFEYVGVPPGRNVRINIWEKADDVVRPLQTDWGPRDEQDRPLGLPLGLTSHKINIHLDQDSLRVVQDSEEIYPLSRHNLNFTEAYVYLQMSTGTNYPSRELYFDNIMVQESP
jgi:hypothetical protein